MDRALQRKLDRDKAFATKLGKFVRDYADLGWKNVEYWAPEWDAAHDLLMCYSSMSKKDLESLEKGHPKRFILPMTATQLTTMTVFVAQSLFGDSSPHKVEARSPKDEVAAEHMNTLLTWNAEQQPTFLLGYLFCQDVLAYNRGIFYNGWAPITRPERYAVEVEIPGAEPEDEPEKYQQTRTRQKKVGAYAKMELVSPHDWCADPTVPLWKAQEGRFMAHRFKIAWVELERRSKLDPEDPSYVLPSAVEMLRKKKRTNNALPASLLGAASTTGTRPGQSMSRSYYERMRITGPLTGESVNASDPGVISCVEMWVRLVPRDQGIHDGADSTVFQFILANGDTILAVNESTYDHGMFPYSYAEGRPGGHYQFAPSWAFLLKGLQDHVDYLKNRHQEALQRTIGNIFVANPEYVDIEQFLDPDREGLILPLKPGAAGMKISDVVHQIPIKDLTERFPEEMQSFVSYSENVTGANNNMQGTSDGRGSATEFAGTQQMAAGRMASVARLISTQALVPQSKQFVSMFQQFMEDTQLIRYQPDPFSSPPELMSLPFLEISHDTVQGEFDFIAHDGSLPNSDAKKVAAITALLQSAAVFPQAFAPGPGNIDPRQLILEGARAAGLQNIERFFYSPTGVQSGVQGQVSAATGGQISAAPGGQPPGPPPATPQLPDVALPSYPSALPPEARPQNV